MAHATLLFLQQDTKMVKSYVTSTLSLCKKDYAIRFLSKNVRE